MKQKGHIKSLRFDMVLVDLLKPWETHITNRYHPQAFLLTVHKKQTHSHKHTLLKSAEPKPLNQSSR